MELNTKILNIKTGGCLICFLVSFSKMFSLKADDLIMYSKKFQRKPCRYILQGINLKCAWRA